MKSITKRMTGLIAAAAMLVMAQTSQAAFSDTLANLAAGGSLSVGDKTFSDFSYLATGMPLFDASAIQVTAKEVSPMHYTLTWDGPVSIVSAAPGGAIADLLLNYSVAATGPWAIKSIDQKYTGSVNPVGGGFLSIDETVQAGGVIVANSHLDQSDLSDPFAEPGDKLVLTPPLFSVDVTKDIAFGLTGPGMISISQIEQSFSQVPEPSTVIAGALLLLPFGASALRILRKNRA